MGQVQNLLNKKYGHPKRVSLSADDYAYAVFLFEPYIKVDGLLRNQWSDERLEGAYIQFEPLSGNPMNYTYAFNGYPAQASYKTRWQTGSDGSLPNKYLSATGRLDHEHSSGWVFHLGMGIGDWGDRCGKYDQYRDMLFGTFG